MSAEYFPGMERERSPFKSDGFPVIAREALLSAVTKGGLAFPFESWAAANQFSYPAAAVNYLSGCESAAEAFFVREFASRAGVTFVTVGRRMATLDDVTVELQVKCPGYRIDLVVSVGDFKLAVEVDGLGYHRQSGEQIAADYIRERRIVHAGYTVIRFTAQEAFSNPSECWRQIDAILTTRRARER